MATVAAVESDFSFRKLKIAGVCLFGQLFGTSMLLVGPLSMLMIPMTQQFGWSRSQFSFATTAIMWAGALASPLAVVGHEWRDAAQPYHVGPSLQIDANGKLLAGTKHLIDLPAQKWVHVEIACNLGKEAEGTYDLSVTLPGEPPKVFSKLPCGSANFRQLQWLGFVSQINGKAVFYLDNISLH